MSSQPFISCENKSKTSSPKKHIFWFEFEVKVFSKYKDWVHLATFIIKCSLAALAPSSIIKQFKDSTVTYSIQILCVFSIFAWLFFSIYFIFTFDFAILRQGFSVWLWQSRISLCIPGWPQTQGALPASASQVQGLIACATAHNSLFLFLKVFSLSFFFSFPSLHILLKAL